MVIFWTLTVAGNAELVNTQLICAEGTTFAAGIVSTLPTRPPKPAGLSVTAALASEQLAEVMVKLAFAASVI